MRLIRSYCLWGRYSQEYVAIVVSLYFLIFESLIRVTTLAWPASGIHYLYQKSRMFLNALFPSPHTTESSTPREKNVIARVREADGFVELCSIWGYEAEEHIVQTKDGYLLGVHRIRPKETRAREQTQGRGGERPLLGDAGKRVVYLHHGLLMSSEIWVCPTEKERCLAFVLVDNGYDVWLGNNRGNKYSKKSIYYSSMSSMFWDFSMDQFALYDIPGIITYILDITKSKSLSYIGFSEGAAQAFASLSIYPNLNEQVDVFIALAPTMCPAGLHNSIVDAFIKALPLPGFLYLLFGRRSMLSSVTFWQSILYPPIFVRLIDSALLFLFNWKTVNITLNQKLAAYAHLYSYTSTKSVVHWFQIIKNQTFQMYDDNINALSLTNMFGSTFYRVSRPPTKNIKTPIVLVWGGCDSLVDIGVMLRDLPCHTVDIRIPHYEHLDMLWAQNVDKLIFPTVLESLEAHYEKSKPKRLAHAHPCASGGENPVPQSTVWEGSIGKNRLVFPLHSEGKSKVITGGSRKGLGSAGSTSRVSPFIDNSHSGPSSGNSVDNRLNSKAILDHNNSQGTRKTLLGPLGAVMEETPSELIIHKPGQPTSHPGEPLAIPRAQTRALISNLGPGIDHSRFLKPQVSVDSTQPQPQPLPTANAIKGFLTNTGPFGRKLKTRSDSISSAASNTSCSSSSIRCTSSERSRGGKIFAAGGITLARAGATVCVSADSTGGELADAERRMQRRSRRERRSS